MGGARVSNLDRYLPRAVVEWDLTAAGRAWREVEASLCFVDISGFTALSERLARRGRVGAEELTDVLNYVFSRMLAIAYQQGGSLLKFGGDALLLLFPGAAHQTCAVRSAVAMRAALRDADKLQSSAGHFRLRMSVGIHSGTVHLFRVGASHHELLISGPAASTTVLMEQTAQAGEIVVSPATADALAPGVVGEPKGPGYLLRSRRVIDDGPGPTPIVAVPEATVAACLPVALRTHLGSVSLESEHRLATVAFLKYRGVDRLLERDGPEPTSAALDATVRAVQSAVDAEGATFLASDLDNDGGKIVLVTGVPTAGDDDEGRMVRALRCIADSPLPLSIQIGVNRGHVFAGEIGSEFRRTFTVMGDTVNLAARLMAAAAPGAILATPSVLDQSRTLFTTESVPPFYVKGKSAPVQAYAVGSARGGREHVRSSSTFVGRDDELAQLEEAFSSVAAGRGRVVVIEGDRGIGKSRLVDEFRGRHSEAVVILLQGEPYGAGTAYLPFQRSLRELFGITTDDASLGGKQLSEVVVGIDSELVPLAPLLAPLLDVDLPDTPESAAIAPEFRRDRTADLVVRLYEAAAAGTLLVVAEDAHWFDEASSGLLERLAAAAADHPWFVAITRRPTAAGLRSRGDQTIELGALDEESAGGLVEAATSAAPMRPHESDAIVMRAGGNPLFLEELVRVARSSGVETLPDSLDGVANRDIDGLPPRARQVLRHAAVLGQTFERQVLRDLLDSEGLDFDTPLRRQLSDHLLDAGDGRLQFRHGLLREAAYEGLPFRRRRELHRLAGDVIEHRAGGDPEGEADVLSLHFFRAQTWDRTWHYARLAGKRAQQVFAPAETALHLERATEATRYLPALPAEEVTMVWSDLADARVMLGYYGQAEDAYQRAATLVVDDPLAWAAQMEKRARVVGENERRHRSSIRLLRRALRRLDSVESDAVEPVMIRLLATEAEVRSREGRYQDALAVCRRVIQRAEDVGELRALAVAYSITDEALSQLGRISEAKHLALALPVYEALGDLQKVGATLGNLGAMAYFEGRWDDAAQLYRRAAVVALRAGDTASVALSEANIGELYANQGRLDEAHAALRHAVRTFQGLGYATHELFAIMQLGRVAAQLGSDAEALTLLGRAVELDDAADGPLSGIEARGVLAEAHILAGRASEGLAMVVAARTRAASILDGTPAGALLDRVEATALAATGQRAGLAERIDRALPGARAAGTYFDLVALLVLRCALSDDDQSGAELARERDRLLDQLGIVALPALGVTFELSY